VIADRTAFIHANTRAVRPPYIPELVLNLAEDSLALWRMTEEELGRHGLPPPFWAFAWAGGQALARHVLDHPILVAGRTVLDVAAGSGLLAIAAMRAGAASARAVDLDPFSAPAVRLNAALNGVEISAETADALSTPPLEETILVGDLFYDRDIAARLLPWLREAAGRGRTVLVGDPGRAYLPKSALEKVAEFAVPVSRDLEDQDVKHTGVWRLR
jgi:predicted nicotinamide N-methyase